MLHQVNYFSSLPEPDCSTLMFIRHFLMDEIGLHEEWKFNTPFYYYKKKWFAFLSYDPKTHAIYISFVKGSSITHPALISNGRKQHRIYMIDPGNDINTGELLEIASVLKTKY